MDVFASAYACSLLLYFYYPWFSQSPLLPLFAVALVALFVALAGVVGVFRYKSVNGHYPWARQAVTSTV